MDSTNESLTSEQYLLSPLPPLFLTSNTIGLTSGLYKWNVCGSSPDLEQNGNKITIKRNCTLLILLDAITSSECKAELLLKKDSRLLNSYKTENNIRNVSVNYVGQFNVNDEIYIESSGISSIQLTIYGNS